MGWTYLQDEEWPEAAAVGAAAGIASMRDMHAGSASFTGFGEEGEDGAQPLTAVAMCLVGEIVVAAHIDHRDGTVLWARWDG